MKDKKTIQRDILDQFRQIEAEENDQLPPRWLEWEYLKELKAEEKKTFQKAMQELVTAGIVESVDGPGLNLRLAPKGKNLIHAGGLHKPGRQESSGPPGSHFAGMER